MKTRTEVLEAWILSKAHWLRLSFGKRQILEDIGPHDCALCGLFNRLMVRGLSQAEFEEIRDGGHCCDGCPVKLKTGKDLCHGTPYDAAEKYVEGRVGGIDHSEFMDLADAELKFLVSLKETIDKHYPDTIVEQTVTENQQTK